MTRYNTYFVITLLIGLVSNVSFAQDFNLKDYRVKFGLSTAKQADGSRLMKVDFVGTNKKDRKDKLPVFDANINFYNVLGDEEIALGSAKTNKEGTATFIANKEQTYLKDSLGFINLKAVFEGSGQLKAKDDAIAVKDLVMDLNLEVVDSIKTVSVKTYTLDSLNNKTPENPYIIVAVKGLISNMPIKDGATKKGNFEFEFPENIKGDAQGHVTVIAKIEDSDEFGTVYQQQNVKWGTISQQEETNTNQLWSKAAPIWMYVVLTILLVGVWANYAYTIANLFKIKKEGN